MTLSRSNTPIGEKRELHESVQELDNLLEDLRKAQVTDEKSHNKRLNQQARLYSSSSSLTPTLSSSHNHNQQHYTRSTNSPMPAKSRETPPLHRLANSSSATRADELDYYTSRLESELNKSAEQMPRGTFVKDVVEEEILVDHVLVQPKTQQSDKRFITKSPDRRPGERARRQVAFSEHHLQAEQDDEAYDNTDNEELAYQSDRHTKRSIRDQSDSMTSLNSATTDQSEITDTSSIIDPSRVINCYTCGGRVVGQVITALGRNYHREHFTCAHCNQELGTKNFYERDGKPYCEKDYQNLFSPKCAACGDPILDKVTIALDQTFHPEHFVCAHCGCQFDVDDGFHERDGKPYCKNDFFELFANKCAGCSLPITANYITALGVQWHPDCFVCSDCHCPFADGKFFDIEGLPYCEIHYHARRGSLCAVCRQPIIGKCTTAMFRKFHPDHFTCTYCLNVLTKSFKEENDKPYCHDCFDKLYS